MTFASLKVSTDNVGDHIQIIAARLLLSRLGVVPSRFIDRDNEIKSVPWLDDQAAPVGIILNGWFKRNGVEWPPHPKLIPIILGFHIRPMRCPELVSDASIEYFRRCQPIGCRDVYTTDLLQSKGVDAFTSNCLSLALPSRIVSTREQTEVFVVSRDERLTDYIPGSIGPYQFISHYSGTTDFQSNLMKAAEILKIYRTRAKLIVTTLLHCALPAIAMGIPVVVFYPINDGSAHESDRERFSSLRELVPIYHLQKTEAVNWDPVSINVSKTKQLIVDSFYQMAARWGLGSSGA